MTRLGLAGWPLERGGQTSWAAAGLVFATILLGPTASVEAQDEPPAEPPETGEPTPPAPETPPSPPAGARNLRLPRHEPRLPGSEPALPERPSNEETPLPEALRPEVETRLQPSNRISVGDQLTLVLTVTAAEGDHISIPDQSFEPFELLDTDADHEPPQRAKVRHVFRARLLALEPGTHTLGMRLRVLTHDQTLGSVQVDPVAIVIASVLGNEPDAEPKPPTSPIAVMETDYTLAYAGGGGLALLLVALAAFFFARWWSRREKPPPPPPPPPPPWDVALERLRQLRGQLAQGGEVDLVTWADELSDCLRQYLGDRYDFDGLESTTDEIVERLKRRRYVGLSPAEVAALLGDLDLIKFAKASPNAEQCGSQLDAAERIVEGTRIQKSFAAPPNGSGDVVQRPEASP